MLAARLRVAVLVLATGCWALGAAGSRADPLPGPHDPPPFAAASDPARGRLAPPPVLGTPLGQDSDDVQLPFASRPGEQPLSDQAVLETRQPEVQWGAAGATDWQAVPSRQTVRVGDRVRTGAGASARLVYFEGSTTEIGPETGLQVQRLERTASGNMVTSLFQAAGTTVSRVLQLVDPAARFEIETPSATAIVRGTMPRVEVAADGTTRVTNLDDGTGGLVLVRGKDPGGSQVTLSPGQAASIPPGLPPAPSSATGTLQALVALRQAEAEATRRQEERQERRRAEQQRAEEEAAAARLGLIAAEAELARLTQEAARLAAEAANLLAASTLGGKGSGPSNNSFTAATTIGSLPARLTAITTNATSDPGEPLPACGPIGKTLWYTLQPTANTTMVIDTAGSSFHTVVAVYTGTALSNLTPVACNAGVGTTNRARVSFNATAGTTYLIQVGGASGESGSLVLDIATGIPAPPNDAFASAVGVSGIPSQFMAETDGASTEPGEPTVFSCASVSTRIGSTVWYSFTPAATMPVKIDTFGSSFDTVLAIYSGATLGGLTPVACSDDRNNTLQSEVSFLAQAGTAYRIQIGGFNGAFGHLAVHFDRGAPPPDNDAFGAAATVGPLPAQTAAVTDTAATEPGEPTTFACNGATVTIGNSVWYAFTPTTTGWVAVDTVGSSYDTVAAVYTGATLGSLTPVACSHDSAGTLQSHAIFNATAGVTYRIQVGGANGGYGNLVVRVAAAPPPPPNDSFTTAVPVTTLPSQLTAATDTATTEPGEPTLLNCTGAVVATERVANTVWYRFTPAITTGVAVDTLGSNFDTVVAVYTGSAVTGLTLVGCNNDSQGTSQSRVVFTAAAGVTYRIQIGGANGSFGNLVANFTTVAFPPPNDSIAAAQPVTAIPAQFTAVTNGATTEPNEPISPVCSGTAVPIRNTVWYTFTPTTALPLTIDTVGSNFDTIVAVYTGPLGPFRVPDIACNDDLAPGAVQSRVSFAAAAGTTYQIQVGGFASAFGHLVVNFSVTPPPANDNFAMATAVGPLPATLTAVTLSATTEPGEPLALDPACGPNVGALGRTVWYTLTPTASTLLTLDTFGSNFDTVLAVYTGSALGGLTRIACNDDTPGVVQSRVTFAATAGTVYRVQIGGFNGASGDLTVHAYVGAPPGPPSLAPSKAPARASRPGPLPGPGSPKTRGR